MKIVLATPLYPPDIAEPAPYVKELARRLSERHTVTVVAYGYLPEQIPGVRIIPVSKRNILPLRLIAYTSALIGASREADVLYAQNGASVELPLWLARISRARVFIRIGDTAAHERARHSFILRSIERLAMRRAQKIITDTPLERPEILPLLPRPDAALTAYEKSWQAHTQELELLFTNEH